MLTTEEREVADTIARAQALLDRGDDQGISHLNELAASGHASAMVALGLAYEMTQFADVEKAEEWYRAAYAAYEGRPPAGAIVYLGHFLSRLGRGDEAKQLFREGAAAGYPLCMYLLATILRDDASPWRDKKAEVRALLERASAHPLAERELAILLIKGKYGLLGVPSGLIRFVRMLVSLARMIKKDPNDPRIADFRSYGPGSEWHRKKRGR